MLKMQIANIILLDSYMGIKDYFNEKRLIKSVNYGMLDVI